MGSNVARFRWGIFGTGAISAKFAAGLVTARDAEIGFVASRSLSKAQAMAQALGAPRAVEGYAQAAAQGGVDAVYIATPPAQHAEHALLCIAAGLPVLIEKPFAVSADDARRIAQAARAHKVFAMEAMWTRFLPAAQAMKRALAQAAVGQPRLVSGSFGISQRPEPGNGMFDPRLGGGALAHLGTYPLSLAQWLFGTPTLVQAMGTVGTTGVDEDAAFQLRYPQGVTASFFVSIRAWAPDDFQVLGTEGMLAFQGSIVRPYGLHAAREAPRGTDLAQFGWRARMRQHPLVHRVAQYTGRSSRSLGKASAHHYAGNGYHYEADEVRACVESKAVESAVMPLDDSIAVTATMERIRAAIMQNQDDLSGARRQECTTP
jgi:predicted dehydrogenase